jgi:undecaprenyl diphosphate synthase
LTETHALVLDRRRFSSLMNHVSSTIAVPPAAEVPRHVAIIMDGNGRWATARRLPRVAGHRQGVEAVRTILQACARRGVEYLTLFAFSSENWRRPPDEVSLLMRLFVAALEREVSRLDARGIRLRVIGDLSAFEPRLQELIRQSQERTAGNSRMTLTVCANYGGRWDVLQATKALLRERPDLALLPEAIAESDLTPHLSMSFAPEPDLFIRTGGEQRISNFLLWQLAYTELYFTDVHWPAFDSEALDRAFDWYRSRERRFGRTSAQVGIDPPGHPEDPAAPGAGGTSRVTQGVEVSDAG